MNYYSKFTNLIHQIKSFKYYTVFLQSFFPFSGYTSIFKKKSILNHDKIVFFVKENFKLKQLLLIFLTLPIICKIATTKHAFIPHENENFISPLCKAYKRLSGVCDLFLSLICSFFAVFSANFNYCWIFCHFCLLCSSRNVGISGIHFHTDAYVFSVCATNILRASNYRDICRF